MRIDTNTEQTTGVAEIQRTYYTAAGVFGGAQQFDTLGDAVRILSAEIEETAARWSDFNRLPITEAPWSCVVEQRWVVPSERGGTTDIPAVRVTLTRGESAALLQEITLQETRLAGGR